MKNNYSSELTPEEHKHEYESLSNDEQMKPIMNPGHVDEGLWDKAKKISMKSYGEIRWPFVQYLYEKLGGK